MKFTFFLVIALLPFASFGKSNDYVTKNSKLVLNLPIEVGPNGGKIEVRDAANLLHCSLELDKKAKGQTISAGTQFNISDSKFEARDGYDDGIYCGEIGSGHGYLAGQLTTRCEKIGDPYSYKTIRIEMQFKRSLIKNITCAMYRINPATAEDLEKEKKLLRPNYHTAITTSGVKTLDTDLLSKDVFNDAIKIILNGPLQTQFGQAGPTP